MELDDELCLCFHVTRRKLLNFIRVEHVRRPGQLADCFGAGTGCGWCRPHLEALFQQSQGRGDPTADSMSAAQYAQGRQAHIAEKERRELEDQAKDSV